VRDNQLGWHPALKNLHERCDVIFASGWVYMIVWFSMRYIAIEHIMARWKTSDSFPPILLRFPFPFLPMYRVDQKAEIFASFSTFHGKGP
jgi:hypothetical protein